MGSGCNWNSSPPHAQADVSETASSPGGESHAKLDARATSVQTARVSVATVRPNGSKKRFRSPSDQCCGRRIETWEAKLYQAQLHVAAKYNNPDDSTSVFRSHEADDRYPSTPKRCEPPLPSLPQSTAQAMRAITGSRSHPSVANLPCLLRFPTVVCDCPLFAFVISELQLRELLQTLLINSLLTQHILQLPILQPLHLLRDLVTKIPD